MSEDTINPDGTVTVREVIEHERIIPLFEYEIRSILCFLTPEEQKKVKQYIVRLTKGRITFRKYYKARVRDFKKQDAKHN